jgi:hypothetical protein
MTAEQTLTAGQSLNDAQYQLIMQNDGNLVEYMEGTPLWSSGTAGDAGDYLVLQSDGNLVIYSSTGIALWNAGTEGNVGDYVALQDDSNLVIYSSAGSPLWADYAVSSKLVAGQTLSANEFLNAGQYQLIMQGDGNLVEYSGGAALWSSGTAGDVGDYLVLQSDGNLVIYPPTGSPLWNSGTEGSAGDSFDVQTDGNLVIYSSGGVALWAKGLLLNGTSGNSGGSSTNLNGYPYANAVDCSATYGIYSWCLNGTWLDPTYGGYAYRNCTDYVAWYLVTQEGLTVADVRGLGNAYQWKSNAAGKNYTGGEAQVGAVAWWGTEVGDGYGHVAIVTQVNSNGTVDIAEYNEAGTGVFSIQSNVTPDGYIDF